MSFLAPTMDVLSRTKLRVWLGGVAVAVLGVGVWGFQTQAVGQHITECHFDARGAYAKVRVNNLLGGADTQQVWVNFSLPGESEPFESGFTSVTVPAHGRVTAVVHSQFPSRDLNVKGRTVYMTVKHYEVPQFVTKKFALEHPGPTDAETVPDDNSLHCSYGGDGYD